MTSKRKPIVAVAATALVAVGLAACGGGSTSGGGSSTKEGTKGGTLYYLGGTRTVEHIDPQRMYIGRDLTNFNRLTNRGLLTFPATEDPAHATDLVPDVATDTGTPSDNAKTWEFTLRDGVKWEDGKPVTCEDFAYGISRTFATDVITGGP
ncbi:ABC transporter substrate-binding protein, partial [Nocardioides guangzhouensis]